MIIQKNFREETTRHLEDRSYFLKKPIWKVKSGEKENILIYPMTHYEKPFYKQEPTIITKLEWAKLYNPETWTTNQIAEGQSRTVTNHPKRSYYATIKRTNGKLKVK